MPGRNTGPTTCLTPFGNSPWIAQNEIWVTKDPNSISLKDAIESCPAGCVVRIFTGSYTDHSITVSNGINIVAEGKVVWSTSTNNTLLTLASANVTITGMVKDGFDIRSTGTGQLITQQGNNYKLKNVNLTFQNFTATDTNNQLVNWTDVKVLSTASNGGFLVDGGAGTYLYCDENFQVGEPLGITANTYGIKIDGGNLHCRGQTNIYADQDRAIWLNGGNAAFYPNGIILVKATINQNAIDVDSGDLNFYGGQISNNSATHATIDMAAGTTCTVLHSYVKNDNGGGNAFNAHATATGDFAKTLYAGAVAIGGVTATDCNAI